MNSDPSTDWLAELRTQEQADGFGNALPPPDPEPLAAGLGMRMDGERLGMQDAPEDSRGSGGGATRFSLTKDVMIKENGTLRLYTFVYTSRQAV